MFIAFSVPVFLLWAFIVTFLPGAIIAFSIFRKDEFNALEKLLIGFAIGMVSLPLIPFLLYLVFGIKFSYAIALLSAAVLYVIAIALFVKNKVYEDLRLPAGGLSIKLPATENELVNSLFSIKPSVLIGAGLLIVLVLTYLVRIGSYSPVFQELDPYYYTYTSLQILSVGYNPANDSTAWYPNVVSHRAMPEVSYLESVWYSFYTGGAAFNYDNMHLALVASMYPPIAAVLAIFFIYLLISVSSRREWGVLTAGIASFIPVLIDKMTAGEQDVQPYAFFGLFFFYAMYALAISRKDLRFAVLAGLAFAALCLGSQSQILALSAAMIFMVGQGVLYFLRDSDGNGLRQLLNVNAIVFVIGPLLGDAVLRNIFASGTLGFSYAGPYLLCLAFVAVLYALKQKITDRSSALMALGVIVVVGLVVFASTSLGTTVKNVADTSFGLAQYNAPLDRTIAEQGTPGTSFDTQMGNIAAVFYQPSGTAQNPFSQLFGYILWLVCLPFTFIVNSVLSLSISFLNFLVGTNVPFAPLDNSALLFWIFAFMVSLVYFLWKFYKKEGDALFLLFLAVVMPPLIVGLLKDKYTTYAAVMLAVAIGFALEPLWRLLAQVGEWLSKNADKELLKKQAYYCVLLIGMVLVLMQFTYGDFASSLAFSSLQPLYQNNPSAFASKFQAFCLASNDSTICAAAADPLGYASNGTNYQYNSELCMASIYSNFSYLNNPNDAPTSEAVAANFRCQRITDYWINAMEWLRYNTPEGSRIVSWWDYGHWINYFGLRYAAIRNDQSDFEMIGEVAYDYIQGTPQDLVDFMKSHDDTYALFDMELVSGGGQLGGKYGALNYLSCAQENETDVTKAPGSSQCEANNLWETAYVSSQPCTISSISNETGVVAYEIYQDVYQENASGQPEFMGTFYTPVYPSVCINPTDPGIIDYCTNSVKAVPTYCVGQVTLANGQQTYGTYYLNRTEPNGDLKLNKAILEMPAPLQNSTQFGPATAVTLFYTNDSIWLDNGQITSGYADRKGQFYSSNLYSALFLGELPGFTLVYSTPDNMVKIYKLNEG